MEATRIIGAARRGLLCITVWKLCWSRIEWVFSNRLEGWQATWRNGINGQNYEWQDAAKFDIERGNPVLHEEKESCYSVPTGRSYCKDFWMTFDLLICCIVFNYGINN